MDHGPHCALRDEPECYLKGLLRTPGFLSAATVLRAEFIIA